MRTLIKNEAADILVDGELIAGVGRNLPVPEGAEVIDATGMIVLPGFVDTHRHTWQTGLRALDPDITIGQYIQRVLGGIGPRFRPEDVRVANLAGALEALDAGITTVVDWSHLHSTPEHTDAALDGFRQAGIRTVLGYAGDDARRVRDSLSGNLITMAIAANGPVIAGEAAALREWQTARELGLRVTGHLGADPVIDFMTEHGFLDIPTNHVHGIGYSDEALKRIADSGGSVALSPLSEMALGSGYPITGRARAAGIPTGLAIDTVIAGAGDMFTMMRGAHALERGRSGPGFTVRDALRMATIEGAEAMGLDGVTGSIEVGKQADLVLLRTDRAGMAGAHDNVGLVVHNAETRDVDTVLVAGRVVKRDGRLLHHDLGAVFTALAASGRYVAEL
ncbi:amidohydrolase family protein [Nonomuraea sp. NPDC050556]|uniref:amidohydrolase family protein n=1 Tax=Nonomuraea sp. NPDC050556 TaxID=3364369 RepID=UPI0037B3D290